MPPIASTTTRPTRPQPPVTSSTTTSPEARTAPTPTPTQPTDVFGGVTRERRALRVVPMPQAEADPASLYAPEEPRTLGPDVQREGGVRGVPRTTAEGPVSQRTFYPVDGDTVPPDFVKRFVLDTFRRNGVTPPEGWEKQFEEYLAKDGFDPKGAAEKFTVRTYIVDGKPQKGIVVAANPEADRSILDAVRGFADQRIQLAELNQIATTMRANPDAEMDFSKYPEPVRGDYEALASVMKGREQAITRGRQEWAPWTLDAVKNARARFAGTTQATAVTGVLDDAEAAVTRAQPGASGKTASDAWALGLLKSAASGEYVARETLDTLPARAAQSVADPTSKAALTSLYTDLVEMQKNTGNPAAFDPARARVDEALKPGSPAHRVLGEGELRDLRGIRDTLVKRRDGTEYEELRTPSNKVAAPVSATRPGFPNPADCELVGGGSIMNVTVGAGKFAGVSGALIRLDDGRKFFAPGAYVGVGAGGPVGGSAQRIQIWAPRRADGTREDPAAVVKGWGLSMELGAPIGGASVNGSVAANHSGYITGVGGGTGAGVSLGGSYAFEGVELPDEFSPTKVKQASTSVLIDSMQQMPTGGRAQLLADIDVLDATSNKDAYTLFERLTKHQERSWSKQLPSKLEARWLRSPERAAILKLVADAGGEAVVRDRMGWPALAPEMRLLARQFYEREVRDWDGR